jgi:hypothetical protein
VARLFRLYNSCKGRKAPDFFLGNIAFDLSTHFRTGVGTPQDVDKCIEYLRVAMKHGITRAYSSLALRIGARAVTNSEAHAADREECARLFKLGAEGGDVAACTNFGCALFRGLGIEGNVADAERWWRVGVWKELPIACFELANALYAGWVSTPPERAGRPDVTTRGIVRNWTEADRLLRIALASKEHINPTNELKLSASEILRSMLCTRGHIVRIHGLAGSPELNGTFAEVQSVSPGYDAVLSDLPERIRVRPRVDGVLSGVKAIRPSNLVAIAPQLSWAEPWTRVDSIVDADYNPATADYRWEYASAGEDGNLMWLRYIHPIPPL